MSVASLPQRAADALEANLNRLPQLQVVLGLDGFVDDIISVVDKRESSTKFSRVPTLAEFGKRIVNAAGKSLNVELVVERTKLGGNGPIMANALAATDVKVSYIGNYGFIPQTYCRDHDPLDILVLSQEPVIPGCVMKAKPIGMLPMYDSSQEDFKIIATHANDPIFVTYTDISQLPPHTLREIRNFFEIYKDLEKSSQVKVEDFRGRIDAYAYVRESMLAYQKFRTRLLKCEYPDF